MKIKYSYDNSSLTSFRISNVSDKNCAENPNTHFMLNNIFFEILAVYEIMLKNILEPSRTQMTVRHCMLYN